MHLKKNVYSALLEWNILYISVKSIWINVSFKANVSLSIFCLNDLSTDVNGVLKSPTIIVLLSVSSFIAVSSCLLCIEVLLCWVHIYL